ncbi:SDR family NAD(P)-dependent oxidoreductase [Streptomyces sp. NBC_01373]|uniref:SDR family NAD(P)-dependent oxidoreductase n=1 Tax=Streptomyces sp. NBC_01373 TaxID=2903843 RepID=UPI00224E330D|nr:SDR family oxidoreductase [Streptomyces sp. NBC_01373]MCX4703220.1 SDR family oxidoreductase [Streptomyces sp. NBC_01373]
MDLELTGRRALVTGAGTGIGRATAEALAAEGCHVTALDIDEKALAELKSQGAGSITPVQVDLSTADGCRVGTVTALENLGGLDILVNNVGAGAVRSFDDLTDDDWQRTFDLNFMSYVRITRACLPHLRQSTGAAIVNNASDLARQPEAMPMDYSASKAAVLAITKGLARAEGPGIRINAVAPGPVWTPFWTKPGGFAETIGEVHGMEPMAAVEHEMSLRQLPLRRLGTPEEVARIITFLTSPAASFVTGSVWGVDGGSVRSLL